MSEFAMCLLVLFLFALFPLINLVMFAANVGTVALLTRNAAAAASTAPNYGLALVAAQSSVKNALSGGFGKFSKLSANGGINNSGVDLYIVATSLTGGGTQVYGPNTPVPGAPDPANFIYEYRAASSFTLQPFVNMNTVPFISNVPVVGAATPFTFNAERAVEEPVGLGILGNVASAGGSSSGGSGSIGSGSGGSGSGSSGSGSSGSGGSGGDGGDIGGDGGSGCGQ